MLGSGTLQGCQRRVPAAGTHATEEVQRGPCKVASKECVGRVWSFNSDHPTWKWRKASKAGVLAAGHPRVGDAESPVG